MLNRFLNQFDEFIARLLSDPGVAIDALLSSPTFTIIQIISGLITILLIFAYIRLLQKNEVLNKKVGELKEAWQQTPLPKGKIVPRWEKIQKRVESNDEGQWKLAIIEADTILDDVIKSMGYKGETMGERMKKIKPEQFPYLDDAWRVHKIRNFIAHDPGYRMKRDTVEKTIDIYKRIFDQLHVLQ